jgi:DNA-binding SARP family transcriptional activator
LLGPLQLTIDGRSVEIGSAKQRALLAVLACHANIVVSVDVLIRALWGDTPPRTAVKNLQVYVYQLRRVLGYGRRKLQRRPPGYVLVLGTEELDSLHFADLVARARAAMAVGELEAATALFRQALGLWRGSAFADLPDISMLRAEVGWLEEERLAAYDLCLQADLDLGRHATVVGELSALAASYPLRERARAQLMLALYRTGRRAEALAVYRDVRRVLVEELAIEPCDELRDLQQRILAGDPTLLRPACADTGERDWSFQRWRNIASFDR